LKIASYPSEQELILALGEGKKQALEYIYSTYWPMIANFVRTNQGSQHEAEDLYQEGIITLYEQVRSGAFQGNSSLKTYLYAICRNKWLNKLKSKIHITDIPEFVSDMPDEESQHTTLLPDDADIKKAIDELGEPCRSILTGFYFHKYSLEQLAEQMGYASDNVAKQQKFRCIERLKKRFSNLNR
jgi:RNA polymerase sigma factor (sigma-70 family)